MVKPNKIDYKKKYEALKKRTEKDKQYLNSEIDNLITEKNKYYDKLQEKSKGYTIKIKAQTFTIPDLGTARERIKKLIDANIWWFEVDEKQ